MGPVKEINNKLAGERGEISDRELNFDTASRGLALSTISRDSSDGVDLIEKTGPTATVVLERAVADPDSAGPLEALEAGTPAIAQSRTVNTYDEDKPDGATYHLLTTETRGSPHRRVPPCRRARHQDRICTRARRDLRLGAEAGHQDRDRRRRCGCHYLHRVRPGRPYP
jgi:hypothetical protein